MQIEWLRKTFLRKVPKGKMEPAIKRARKVYSRETEIIRSEAGKGLACSRNKRTPKWYEMIKSENLANIVGQPWCIAQTLF